MSWPYQQNSGEPPHAQNRGLADNEDGVAAVEFALVLPIYLSVLMFFVEMARIVSIQVMILHAAEETTRYALVNFDATIQEISDFARNSLPFLDPANLTAVLVTAPVDPDDQTKEFSVQINYQYTPLMPLTHFFSEDVADGFSLSGTSSGFLAEEIPVS
ncbi:MAG: pilus assembly protein [Kordiimonadaceae bacterium]|nr:pilus assembly protein [Kordiimonadaceae bacterium]